MTTNFCRISAKVNIRLLSCFTEEHAEEDGNLTGMIWLECMNYFERIISTKELWNSGFRYCGELCGSLRVLVLLDLYNSSVEHTQKGLI